MKGKDLVPNLGYILPQYISGNLKHLCKRKKVLQNIIRR